MPAGRVRAPPVDRQKLVKLINSRDTAIGRRASCFVDRLDLGIGVGGLISLLALCVGVLEVLSSGFFLCFSPLSRGVSRALKLASIPIARNLLLGGGNVGGNGGGNTSVGRHGTTARRPTNPKSRPACMHA